jgi:hypothetical protein
MDELCAEWCGGELPSARAVSTLLSPDVNLSSPNLSHMITTFGQLVSHDIRFEKFIKK